VDGIGQILKLRKVAKVKNRQQHIHKSTKLVYTGILLSIVVEIRQLAGLVRN